VRISRANRYVDRQELLIRAVVGKKPYHFGLLEVSITDSKQFYGDLDEL
jgi:hypothetical protein